jgi:DNA-binding beta-propeller fold protein YncE
MILRRSIVIRAVAAAVVAVWGSAGAANQVSAPSPSETRSTYHLVKDWVPTPPYPTHDWEMSSVTVDPDGRRVYATRRSDPPILEIDGQSGKVLRQYGTGLLVWPHGIYLDKEGAIWIADATVGEAQWLGTHPQLKSALDAGRGHQVMKLSHYGEPVLELGTRGKPGNDDKSFNAPAAVAVAPSGDIFIVDGHGQGTNNRIVKYSKEGKFVKAWGTRGSGPGDVNGPHAVAIDSRGRLLIADRGNHRIEIFDQDGKYLADFKLPDMPHGIALMPDDTMFVSLPHRILIGSAVTGKITGSIDDDVDAEGIAVDRNGNIYVAEVFTRSLKKFSPR